MPSRDDIVAEARRWIDTPYHHEGRQRGASCDCIGLVIGVARGLGLACPSDRDLPRYTRWPHDHIAERTASALMEVATEGSIEAAASGQVGLFWWRDPGHGQHFCIFGEVGGRRTMIHAYYGIGKVTEAGISAFWRKRLLRVYDYREIANGRR